MKELNKITSILEIAEIMVINIDIKKFKNIVVNIAEI